MFSIQAYMHMYLYNIYIYIFIHSHKYNTFIFRPIHVGMYYPYVYIYIYIYMPDLYMYVCIIHVYIYIYIYMYTSIHIGKSDTNYLSTFQMYLVFLKVASQSWSKSVSCFMICLGSQALLSIVHGLVPVSIAYRLSLVNNPLSSTTYFLLCRAHRILLTHVFLFRSCVVDVFGTVGSP